MKFEPKKHFKFKVLGDMEELVGKTIKAYDENNMDDYSILLTEDNSLIAFYGSSSYDYPQINIMDEDEISYKMSKGKVSSFYTYNELVDMDNYNQEFKEYQDNKNKIEEEKRSKDEYAKYMQLKRKFDSK